MIRLWLVLCGAISATSLCAMDATAFAAARALYEAGNEVEAQSAFEKIAATDAANPELNYYLGELSLRRDDATGAIALFEKAVNAAPTVSRYQHRLGDAFGRAAQKASLFSQIGLAKKCLAAYQRAVALDGGNVEARHCLLEYYRHAPALMGGGEDKAWVEAAAIKKLDPRRGRIAFATLYVAQKKYDAARAEFAEYQPVPLATVQAKSVLLADVNWASAAVGWGQPARNHHWFDEQIHGLVALRLGGRVMAAGLYAHSASRYVFEPAAKWQSFTAIVGLCDGAHQQGSAIFTVRGDGRELFRSKLLRVGATQKVSVDVSGVNQLELIAEGGEGHNHNSWAVWGDPALSR